MGGHRDLLLHWHVFALKGEQLLGHGVIHVDPETAMEDHVDLLHIEHAARRSRWLRRRPRAQRRRWYRQLAQYEAAIAHLHGGGDIADRAGRVLCQVISCAAPECLRFCADPECQTVLAAGDGEPHCWACGADLVTFTGCRWLSPP